MKGLFSRSFNPLIGFRFGEAQHPGPHTHTPVTNYLITSATRTLKKLIYFISQRHALIKSQICPSKYFFPCHYCKKQNPAGTSNIGVKPYLTAVNWLRFCASNSDSNCYLSWVGDPNLDPSECAPKIHIPARPSSAPPTSSPPSASLHPLSQLQAAYTTEPNQSGDRFAPGVDMQRGISGGSDFKRDGDDGDEEDNDIDIDSEIRVAKEDQCAAIFDAASEFITNMPRIQDSGLFSFASNQSKAKKLYMKFTHEKVQEWLTSHESRGGSVVKDAEQRALMKRPSDGIWTDESKALALRCFYVGNVKFEPCLFELFDHQALLRHPLFHKKDVSGNIVGVLVCCPHCRSNAFVTPLAKYSTSSVAEQRTYDGFGYKIVRIGQTYTCSNSMCPAVEKRRLEKKANDAQVKVHFSSWTQEFLDSLPISISNKYIGGAELSQGGYSPGLGNFLMASEDTISSMFRQLRSSFEQANLSLLHRYLSFVETQQPFITSNQGFYLSKYTFSILF